MAISKIPLTRFEGGKQVPDINYETIKTVLGVNYSTRTNIFYKGNNDKIGIHLWYDNTDDCIKLNLYSEDSDGDEIIDANHYLKYSLSSTSELNLYYKKGGDCVAFGLGRTTASVNFFIDQAQDLENSTPETAIIKWAYSYNVAATGDSNKQFYVLTELNELFSNIYGNATNRDFMASFGNIVSLSPFAISNYMFHNLFIAYAFPSVQDTKEFRLNKKSFISSYNSATGPVRIVMVI